MSDDTYFTDPWQTRQVLDPSVESNAYESIIQMIFDHNLPDVAHIIMSNYTWQHTDLTTLLPFYEGVGEEFDAKLSKFQENCEPDVFAENMRNYALIELPIYSKSIDASKIGADSSSRVFHDPKEFLDNGSAADGELYKFVYSVMKDTLAPIFTPKEIKKVLREPIALIETLFSSRQRDEKLGKESPRKLDYEIAHHVTGNPTNFGDFQSKISSSINNFLVYFALHTIRSHCFANFGVDGELKFFQREMYQKALEDLRTAKTKTVSVKKEKSAEKTPVRVKPEKEETSSDEDFCQIIEVSAAKSSKSPKVVKKEAGVSEKRKIVSDDGKDFPEKYLLDDLNREDLPMNFKTKFRKLVDKNQMMRDEIKDYKELIQLKISEKKAQF